MGARFSGRRTKTWRWWTGTLLVSAPLLAVMACAGGGDADQAVRFMVIGDPQLFGGCSADSTGTYGVFSEDDPRYINCSERQVARYVRTLELANELSAKGRLDFVWILGDHTQTRSDYQKRRTREVLEKFPSLELHMALGNHDVNPKCGERQAFLDNAFDQDPVVCGSGNFGTSDLENDCRRPAWEHWKIRGVHFFTFDGTLWGGKVRKACDAPKDGPFAAEAQAQRAAFEQAVVDASEDSGFVRMITGAHFEVWRGAYSDPSVGNRGGYNFDNVWTCEGGDAEGEQCDPDFHWTCKGGGRCSRKDESRQYREEWRKAMRYMLDNSRRCLLVHHFSGHGHRSDEWHEELDGCQMEFFETVNLNGDVDADPAGASKADQRPAVRLVTVYPDARVRQRLVYLDEEND
jgi:hypothetical protein